MFLEVANLLGNDELVQLRQVSETLKFVDGRLTNPHNTTKNNQQADHADEGHAESSRIAAAALARNQQVGAFAFPKRIAAPLMSKYTVGMSYGAHSDSAYLPIQPVPLRSDVSCTIFLSDPGSYVGGELVAHLGSKPVAFKGDAGSAILYPSTTLHEVRPVRSGVRLVMITFMESYIRDHTNRELLYELGEVAALTGLSMPWELRVRLEQVRTSLHRMWAS